MPPGSWSTDQLKEFFEERAKEHDRRLQVVEDSVTTISRLVSGMNVKVNSMWAAIGVVSVAVMGSLIKLLGG